MSIQRWEPWRELEGFRRGFDRLFSMMPWTATETEMAPRIDLYETGDEVVASVEVPGGLPKEDLDVNVTEDSLYIHGKIERKSGTDDERYHHQERFYGAFARTVPLPHPVVPEKATAKFENGVLEVHMPKDEKSRLKGKRLEIQ